MVMYSLMPGRKTHWQNAHYQVLYLWVVIFIAVCVKAEHGMGIFIRFSMCVASGDKDLNFEIKLSGCQPCKVGMFKNSHEA